MLSFNNHHLYQLFIPIPIYYILTVRHIYNYVQGTTALQQRRLLDRLRSLLSTPE